MEYYDLLDAFLSNVKKGKEDWEHWIWTGTIYQSGHGIVKFRGRRIGAHRLALHLYKGLSLDSRLDALHKCNRKNCVNPWHLEAGTHKENMQDCIRDFERRGLLKRMKIGDHCNNGHLIESEEDIYFNSQKRFGACRFCKRENDKRAAIKKKFG